MKRINLIQGTPEWLEFRKGKIGASDAPIIMRAAKWKLPCGRIKTPLILWEQHMGLRTDEHTNRDMQWGKDNEERARHLYSSMKGESFFPAVYQSSEHDWMIASLDGINMSETHMVEIKCCSKEDFELAQQGFIPDKYIPQVLHQRTVCESVIYHDYFAWYDGKGIIIPVKHDPIYSAKILLAELEFMKCLETLTPPALCEDDLTPQNAVWGQLAEKLWDIKQQKKRLEDQEDEVEAALQEICAGEPSCYGAFTYTSHIRKGNVVYKDIPEMVGVDLEAYRSKPTQVWKLKKND